MCPLIKKQNAYFSTSWSFAAAGMGRAALIQIFQLEGKSHA